jgi:hypothetical protein
MTVYTLVTFNLLAYSYFHVMNLSQTGRRIRMIRVIRNAGGSIDKSELYAKYGAADMLRVRLDRLQKWGQIVRSKDRYIIKGKLLFRIAKIIHAGRSLLRMR